MISCASCGGPLGALTEARKKQLQDADNKADEAFAKAIAKASKDAKNIRLQLSTTTKLTGTDKDRGKTKNAFSLPAGPKFSCPGATDVCEGCYARMGRFIATQQREFYARNWVRWIYLEKIVQDETVAANELLTAIRKSCSPYGSVPTFRLWESGDFHSQWSVNVWVRVIRALPDVQFWGYTRNFALNYDLMAKMPNLLMWASTDRVNYQKAVAFVQKYPNIRHAYWWDPLVPAPSGTLVCPATQPVRVHINEEALRVRKPEFFSVEMKMPLNGYPETGKYAPGACGTCRYCLPAGAEGAYSNLKKTSVTFLDHEAVREAAVSRTYVDLQLAKERGEADLYTEGRTEEVEAALLRAREQVEAEMEVERLFRRSVKEEAKSLGDYPRGTGLRGLGQTVENGLVDGCMYVYGRDDYFPG